MSEAVLASLITGVLSLIGVMLSNQLGARKMEAQLEKAQAITDTRLQALAEEVREHNGFARRMPVVEEQIKVLSHRVGDLEKKE